MLESGGDYMKENIKRIKDTAQGFWVKRTKNQKGIFIGSIVIIILILSILSFTLKSNYVSLYNNLSVQEVGQIKAELDNRNIAYEVSDGGTTISVLEEEVDTLIVELAAEGIPSSGNIDYSFFSENTSWGVTDNEFNIMKLDAMQNELANLIRGIEGINDADVMITLPEESVFVSDTEEETTAAIMLNTDLGYEFKDNQIESLYHLVSKAVPDLPPENIAIMNQYFEYFDKQSTTAGGSTDEYTYHQTVKKDIERDIQRRLQQMLGAMVGMENVIVSVTTDIDFTKENRVEELVDPVDLENMEGLPVSIETIHETYSGNPAVGGTPGTGDEDIPGYEAVEGDGNGEYELVKETINNEFNRIHKDIVESPYRIRDIGVQVAIDSVVDRDGEDIQYLSQQDQSSVEEGITSILNSIIATSIDKEFGEIDPEEKTSIIFQEFSEEIGFPETTTPIIPWWVYVAGAILIIAVIVLIVLLLRSRREEVEEIFKEDSFDDVSLDIPEISEGPVTETDVQRKQLEKMAETQPEEFTKLLRSWISDD